MNRTMMLVLIFLLAAGAGATDAAQTIPTGAASAGIVAASKKFLAALDDAQRSRVLIDFKDDAQRRRWSNLPPSSFKRQGLRNFQTRSAGLR